MKTLKKYYRFFILLMACMAWMNASAQLTRSTIGIKAGMNISQLSVSGLTDEQNRVGYHAGVFARLGITSLFAIQPEVLFATKGSELNYHNAFVTGGAIISLKYADVPLLAVFNLTDHLNIHMGPYYSYLIDVSVKNKSTSDGSDFAGEVNKENFKRNDFGFIIGTGLEFRALNFGVRYMRGLTKVGKEKQFFGQPSYDFPDGKNTVYQVYIGLSFF